MQEQPTPPQQTVIIQQAPTNGLGVAGFVTSLVSLLFTCGFLSPVSFLLSLIGLTKKPRGLAIAGAIISALQLLVLLLVGVGPILALIGMGISMREEQVELYDKNRVEVLETLRTTDRYEEVSQISSDYSLVNDEELKSALEDARSRVPAPSPSDFDDGVVPAVP